MLPELASKRLKAKMQHSVPIEAVNSFNEVFSIVTMSTTCSKEDFENIFELNVQIW